MLNVNNSSFCESNRKQIIKSFRVFLCACLLLIGSDLVTFADEQGLIGHWTLSGDTNDSSGHGHHGESMDVDLSASGPDGRPNGAARFDGRRSLIEVPASSSLNVGDGDFSLAVWVHTEEKLDDAIGDLLSKFDPVTRRGINLCIKNTPGTSGSQPNYRNIHFGLDSGTEPTWTDCGRPGNSRHTMALAVHDGELFAGTCEHEVEASGHVFRYLGDQKWHDCGSPDRCNGISSLATYQGSLYAGTCHYLFSGTLYPESPNENPGGKVFRYDGDQRWIDCGKLGETNAVGGLVNYRGELYGTSMYHPAGLFRYDGKKSWTACPAPSDGRRVNSPTVFNGNMYTGSYDGCAIYRFDGKSWSEPMYLESRGQVYSLEIHGGAMYAGVWPSGKVYRSADGQTWTDSGQLGKEIEVMGIAVYNGKLYGGTLPLAQVYRYDGDNNWMLTGRLDFTPNVRMRRAWSMAVSRGKLFCGTLPSGRVHSLQAGQSVTYDHELKPGWRHLCAVRQSGRLLLHVDGQQVASSTDAETAHLDLSNDQPLRIGFGGHDYFNGCLSDLRIYRRALTGTEIADLAKVGQSSK